MKLSTILGLLLFNYCFAYAQEKVVIALPVIMEPDTIAGGFVVNLQKPAGINFTKGQTFICKGAYKNADIDTITKGYGTLSNVLPGTLEGHINTTDLRFPLTNGDICYLMIKGDDNRKDVFYKLARFAIGFIEVNDNIIFAPAESLGIWDEERTKKIMTQLTADIQYTGKAMLDRKDQQQQIINGGDYDGKPLFTAMQEIKENEVLAFLQYIFARPTKYSGHYWKISEIFATWITSGTPKAKVAIE